MISTPREFLDSNVLVYAFTTDPRAARAQGLLARGCTISVQGLNEFTNVGVRRNAGRHRHPQATSNRQSIPGRLTEV